MKSKAGIIQYQDVYLSRPWNAFYPKGLPLDIPIPDISVPDLFDEVTEKWKNNCALDFYGRHISYGELRDLSNSFANALHSLGIKKDDSVAIALFNSPQFIIAFFGTLKAGAVITPINPGAVSREIARQLIDSEARTVICQDVLFDVVRKSDTILEHVIISKIDDYLPEDKQKICEKMFKGLYVDSKIPTTEISEREHVYSFQDLIKRSTPNPPKISFTPQEDLAVLPYTGGTTALPKAAMLTHYNYVASTLIHIAFSLSSFEPGTHLEPGTEVFAAYLPFHHIMGQVAIMLQGLIGGHRLILFSTPNFDDILASIRDDGVTVFFSVPNVLIRLEDYDETDRINWKQVKFMNCGADILPDEVAKRWEKRIGFAVHQGYGLTETTASCLNSPLRRAKIGSIGVPLPNTYAAVIEPDTGKFLPIGEIGELIVSGPHVMASYWKRPDETKHAFIELSGKRWYRTGDLVRMDDEGYIFFCDRIKDLIKYKGHSIFAKEIEEVLIEHPMIKEVAVVGVPDIQVGSKIKAVIVPNLNTMGTLKEEEIVAYCKEKLTSYKRPKLFEFRTEIPKTGVGKIARKDLREEGSG